jgi:dTDP-glucose 4,6-dehydratase
MRLLVTGGAGFMGSNFIRYILHKYPHYEIVNLDKLTYAGNLQNLTDIEERFATRYRFIKGDIAVARLVKNLVREVDAIINYAAETHVDRSIMSPRSFIMTDILGTYTLLEAAKQYQIKRFIQISTDEVYGSTKKGVFTEESPFRPNSPYSASKAGADHLVRAYFKTFGLPTIITHSVNFMGPYQYPEKLIPLFITNLLEDKKVPLYGDGKNVREWIFTQDHCAAIDLILHEGKIGETYNIGTGYEKTNLTITRLILKELGKGKEYIEFVPDRPGHDFRYALNWTKLKKLGWEPHYSFEEALKITIQWYKDNPAWWKSLKSRSYQLYYKKQYTNRS